MESGFLEAILGGIWAIMFYGVGFAVFVFFVYTAYCIIAMKDETEAMREILSASLRKQHDISQTLGDISETVKSMSYSVDTLSSHSTDRRVEKRTKNFLTEEVDQRDSGEPRGQVESLVGLTLHYPNIVYVLSLIRVVKAPI